MADLSQTPANVRAGSGAVTTLATAGEAFDAGMPLYLNSNDGRWYKADADDSSKYNATGYALTGSDAAADSFVVQTGGQCNVGATTVQGQIYVVSSTAGKIAPSSDMTTNWYPAIVGAALNTGGDLQLILKSGTSAMT